MFVASSFVFEECFGLGVEGFDQIWLARIGGWSVAWYCGGRVSARHIALVLFCFAFFPAFMGLGVNKVVVSVLEGSAERAWTGESSR